jgi:hypothetical protein
MADQATQELRSTPTDEHSPIIALPPATSVANPRRIRLTRLGQEASRSH